MKNILRMMGAMLLSVFFIKAGGQAINKQVADSLLTSLRPDEGELHARMKWFKDARFGMFVHWGVYSPLGCSWDGKKYEGYGEHIQRMAKIPVKVYREKVAGTFNPGEFNAREWIRLAKRTGMKYFIITAKHHDGFAMYDSRVNDYNIVKATPFGRDPMIALREACREEGIKFGFYYSHAFDWGEEKGVGNDWDYNNPGGDKLLGGANWWENRPAFIPVAREYVDQKAIPQIEELIARYDPDIMWFDTPHKLPQEEDARILAAVRKAKPGIIVNGRTIAGFGKYDYLNTADCPYEFSKYAAPYWEGIPTTNNSYAYNEHDNDYKPASFFIRLLVKAAARGGNILMNVGPMGNGKISPPDVAILKEIGDWWQVNGEAAIRGTEASPLPVHSWGETTRKGKTIYLHVFNWPEDGNLIVGGLAVKVTKAYLLSNKSRPIKIRQEGIDLSIELPRACPDSVDAVIALECEKVPNVADPHRLLSEKSEDQLRTFDAQLKGGVRYSDESRKRICIQQFKSLQDQVSWPVRLKNTTTYDVWIDYEAPLPQKSDKLVEGDAGKEIKRASTGAGGIYIIRFNGISLEKKVQVSAMGVSEYAGSVTLPAGSFDISICAKEITGAELFRPRAIRLKPSSKQGNTGGESTSGNPVFSNLGKAFRTPAMEQEGYWVWGSSVVQAPDGKYHMYVSRFPKTLPFHPGWMVASEIIHGVSAVPQGPYVFSDVALPPRGAEYWDGRSTHNPRIVRYKDKYYLFYMGSTHPFEEPTFDNLTLDSKWCIVGRSNKRIGVAVASSPYGPWKRFDEPIIKTQPGSFYSHLTSNPAPVVEEDGSVLIVFKGRRYLSDSTWSEMKLGVAHAPAITGPYTVLNNGAPILQGNGKGEAEDPFLWKDTSGYHLIFKDHKGLFTGESGSGVLAHSKEGIQWDIDKDPKAYSKTVTWEDGGVTVQGQLERSFILFEGGKPAYIFFATMDGPGGFERASRSWNMVIPFKK